jgi:hypothetical protein
LRQGDGEGAGAAVPSGKYPFLLSDVSGSAALASVMDLFGCSGGFSYFDYWPIRNIGQESAVTYSFGDGGILENTDVIPLLRRRYRVIFAFVNTPFPVRVGLESPWERDNCPISEAG